MRTFASIAEFAAQVGQRVGTSDWRTVDQRSIDLFAEATGDHQWIHVDAERAAAGPFGATIAHGYLTLSLLPMLAAGVYKVDGVTMGINYGLNKVRFLSPVRVGSRVRATGELVSVMDIPGGVQAVLNYVVELEDSDKPACAAETIVRLLGV